MLTKILFTLLVIIGVAIFYRNKSTATAVAAKAKPVEAEGSLPTRTLAYILIGVLIAISASIFVYSRHQDNRIINIKVTSEGGDVVHYQARHRDIKGRNFKSLEGINVTLGQGDRVEMLSK
ncbi:MAG: hypothetical protein ACR2QW_18540 [bacterium]